MFFDSVSNVTFSSFFEISHRSYARSSMVMASVSTFHDHKATPAASVAARRCLSCQTGIVLSPDDILLLRLSSYQIRACRCDKARTVTYPGDKRDQLRSTNSNWTRPKLQYD